MIRLALIGLVMTLSPLAANAGNKSTYTGSFVTSGTCEEQIWVNENGGHWLSPAPVIRGANPDAQGFAFVTIANVGKVGLGTGPTDDGAGGCALLKSMNECASKVGSFEIDDGQDVIYSVGPMVSGFRCH